MDASNSNYCIKNDRLQRDVTHLTVCGSIVGLRAQPLHGTALMVICDIVLFECGGKIIRGTSQLNLEQQRSVRSDGG